MVSNANDKKFEFSYKLKDIVVNTVSEEIIPDCYNLSEAPNGFVKICELKETADEGVPVLVVNRKLYNLTLIRPLNAFDCGSINRYATDQDAIILSSITGYNIYTPLGSYKPVHEGSSQNDSKGLARYLRYQSETSIIRNSIVMYNAIRTFNSLRTLKPTIGNQINLSSPYINKSVLNWSLTAYSWNTNSMWIESSRPAYRACTKQL